MIKKIGILLSSRKGLDSSPLIIDLIKQAIKAALIISLSISMDILELTEVFMIIVTDEVVKKKNISVGFYYAKNRVSTHCPVLRI